MVVNDSKGRRMLGGVPPLKKPEGEEAGGRPGSRRPWHRDTRSNAAMGDPGEFDPSPCPQRPLDGNRVDLICFPGFPFETPWPEEADWSWFTLQGEFEKDFRPSVVRPRGSSLSTHASKGFRDIENPEYFLSCDSWDAEHWIKHPRKICVGFVMTWIQDPDHCLVTFKLAAYFDRCPAIRRIQRSLD